jgi:hypothetical protein
MTKNSRSSHRGWLLPRQAASRTSTERRRILHPSKWIVALLIGLLALVPAFLFGGATTAQGQIDGVGAQGDICPGVITDPGLPLGGNTRLTCDVECATVNAPCIWFAASGIKFSLNGFTMTGPANPPTLQDCVTTGNFVGADGIQAAGRSDIVIEGPGVVQKFRRHGVALVSASRAVVKKLVSHQNCFSGVFLGGTSDSLVEEAVSVKNSAASSFFTCGGVCITNSNGNRIRRSELAGNGSAAVGSETFAFCPVPVPNDFGVGLVGTSSGNIIEENGIGGNINGVFVCPNAGTNPLFGPNLIRKNVIAGNPPIQVSADNPQDPVSDPVGADVRDFSTTPGANRFEENLCLTADPNPSPCLRAAVEEPVNVPLVPRIPQFAGHQNN